MKSLHNKSFKTMLDYTPEEIKYYLDLAAKLKADKKAGTEIKTMEGKNFVLIFEKDSTRTRCAFEVGAADQGAYDIPWTYRFPNEQKRILKGYGPCNRFYV